MRPPLTIRLRPSRLAVLALAMIHGLALAALATSHLALTIKLLLLLPLALSMSHGLRTHAWRNGPDAVVALILRGEGELELMHENRRHNTARIDVSSVATHWLIALRLDQEGRKSWLPLLSDSMSAEEFRRFQIWLRGLAASRS